MDEFGALGELCSTPILQKVIDRRLQWKYEFLKHEEELGRMNEEKSRILEKLESCKGSYTVSNDPAEVGFITDETFTEANLTEESLKTEIAKHHIRLRQKNKNRIILYPGFIGKTKDSRRTTLGRDGSNITFTALAAAIRAEYLKIFTDTEGVLYANPKYIYPAQSTRNVSIDEQIESSEFGGMKVIQYRSGIILKKKKSYSPVVQVLNSFNPEDPGTIIRKDTDPSMVKAVGLGIIPNASLRAYRITDSKQFEQIEGIINNHDGTKVVSSSIQKHGDNLVAYYVIERNQKVEQKKGSEQTRAKLFYKIKEKVFDEINTSAFSPRQDVSLISPKNITRYQRYLEI